MTLLNAENNANLIAYTRTHLPAIIHALERAERWKAALEVSAIDSMSIVEWAEAHYPGLNRVPEWQFLKEQHRHCVKIARAALEEK